MNDKIREEFEAWASSRGMSLEKDYAGFHSTDVVRMSWDAWRAAYEAHHKNSLRYQWLRKETPHGPNIQVSEWIGPHEYRLHGEELDCAIDTAIEADGLKVTP